MTTDADSPVRIRLEEILDDVRTLDGQVADPLTLEPAIRNLEGTIEAYERIGVDVLANSGGNR